MKMKVKSFVAFVAALSVISCTAQKNVRKRGCVKTPNINNKKLVVRSCVDVQRVFVFLQKRAL